MPEYTFTHDGVVVQYFPATVGSRQTKKRILRLLLTAYGYPDGNATPPDEWDNFEEYADYMSRSKTDAPWWISSAATADHARRALEMFQAQEGDLYDAFLIANQATTPEKKAPEKTPTT